MITQRPSRPPAPTAVAVVVAVVLLTSCGTPPWVPPVPDATVSAQGLVDEPQPVLELPLPPRDERWVQVTLPVLAGGGAALVVAEVTDAQADDEPDAALDVRLEWRSADGGVLAVGASGTRYARTFAALMAGEAPMTPVELDDGWRCRGPCVAARARSGETYLRIENTADEARTLQLWAYARRPSDLNEPNDSVATATRVELRRDGDGADGAIEHPGDDDHYRLECAPGFAGPSDGVRVRVESGSELAPMLRLAAGGARYDVGVESETLPCGSVVSVSTRNRTAGPGASSWYTLRARAAPLYLIDAPAQPLPTSPTPLGRLTLAPGETQSARVSFGASAASLRFVEVVGVGGGAADGAVLLDVRSSSGLVGVSSDRRRFAASVSALAGGVTAATLAEPVSITVANACLGPCVAERYRTGSVVARVTNTSTRTRSVDLFAYGAVESDGNEPNDSVATATPVTVPVAGTVLAGAIERLGDRDAFTLACSAQRADMPLVLTLDSAFPGPLRVRPWGGGASAGAGGSIPVPCGTTVVVESSDGSAGPSAASGYVLRIE